jgi:hypothetical protein
MSANVSDERLQGLAVEKVSLDARRLQAMQRQLLRMTLGFRAVQREMIRIAEGARHADGCPASKSSNAPCLPTCPDREMLLSSLVAYHAASQFTRAPVLSKLSDYSPPSREYFDAIVCEIETLRSAGAMLRLLETGAGDAVREMLMQEAPPGPPPDEPITRLIPVDGDDALPENDAR